MLFCRNIFLDKHPKFFLWLVFRWLSLYFPKVLCIFLENLWIFWTTTQNDMSAYKTLLNYSVLFVILNLTAVLINFAINRMVTILYSNTFYSITRTVSHHIQSISLYKEIKFNSSKITHQLQVDANEIVSFSLGIFQ